MSEVLDRRRDPLEPLLQILQARGGGRFPGRPDGRQRIPQKIPAFPRLDDPQRLDQQNRLPGGQAVRAPCIQDLVLIGGGERCQMTGDARPQGSVGHSRGCPCGQLRRQGTPADDPRLPAAQQFGDGGSRQTVFGAQ